MLRCFLFRLLPPEMCITAGEDEEHEVQEAAELSLVVVLELPIPRNEGEGDARSN